MTNPAPVMSRAVVCRGLGQLSVETLKVHAPQEGQVRVRMVACGVCHSDLSSTDGTIAAPFPLVLGHEASGVVESVGPGVVGLNPGDHVVTSFVAMCGRCRYCVDGRPALCEEGARAAFRHADGSTPVEDALGAPMNVFSGCGVMAEFATLSVANVVKIRADVPLIPAALISCGVMTGVGAVINTAGVQPGDTVVVVGAGGVGLNAVQGARLAGARRIVAVDRSADKLEMAKEFGATDTLDAEGEADWARTVKAMTGGGADWCFDCVGRGAVLDLALRSVRKGGTAVSVGVAPRGETVSVKPLSLTFEEKRLIGSYFGSARPQRDFPRLLDLYQAGKLKLDELVTRTYGIEEGPTALADLAAGRNARGVIVFPAKDAQSPKAGEQA